MVRIAVLDDFQGVAHEIADWDSIPDAEVTFFQEHTKDPDELVRRLEPFEVVQMMRERTPIPATVIERLPHLRLLSGTGRRQPQIDLEAATRRGVPVTTSGGGSGASTGELAWGLIISLFRHIPHEDRELRRGHWQTRMGETMAGQTLGIQGMGRIGTQMARFGRAFEMNVIAWGPTLTPERAQDSGATYVSWDELFSQSDVVTIHVPLTEQSRGWIGARELGLMKPTAYLVNTARAPIVEQDALLDALRNRRIAGAGLDVFEQEPLPADHPLLALDNVVVTPHLGYASRESLAGFYEDAIENIKAWLRGEPRNVLNPEVLQTT